MAILARVLTICCIAAATVSSPARADEVVVRVGSTRSIGNAANLIAIANDYFKDSGLRVEIVDTDPSVDVFAMLAQGKLQVAEADLSAGFFTAVQKGLPIMAMADRASSPLNHNLMLRASLKDKVKEAWQLKGRSIAIDGQGSAATYEVGKILDWLKLSIADVDLRVFPIGQVAGAFKNETIDAALVPAPYTAQFVSQGLAVPLVDPDEYIRPTPMTLSVNMVNTDWLRANIEAAKAYYLAYTRGVRDYCQAYHGGKYRYDVGPLLMRTGAETRPDMISKGPWPARDPLGRINIESVLDMQAWFAKNRFINGQSTAVRLVDTGFVEYAANELGPFVVENTQSKLRGCR